MCPQTLKSSVVSDCLKKIMNEVIVQQLTTTTPVLLRSTYYKRINNTKLLHELSSPPNLSLLIIGATSKVYTYKKKTSLGTRSKLIMWPENDLAHVVASRSCIYHHSEWPASNIMLTAQPAYGQVDT